MRAPADKCGNRACGRTHQLSNLTHNGPLCQPHLPPAPSWALHSVGIVLAKVTVALRLWLSWVVKAGIGVRGITSWFWRSLSRFQSEWPFHLCDMNLWIKNCSWDTNIHININDCWQNPSFLFILYLVWKYIHKFIDISQFYIVLFSSESNQIRIILWLLFDITKYPKPNNVYKNNYNLFLLKLDS